MIEAPKFEIDHVTVITPVSGTVYSPKAANRCTKFEIFSFGHSRYILGGLKIFNWSRDMTRPLSGTVCCP